MVDIALEQRVKELELQNQELIRAIASLQHINAELVDAINEYGHDEDFRDGKFKPKRKENNENNTSVERCSWKLGNRH